MIEAIVKTSHNAHGLFVTDFDGSPSKLTLALAIDTYRSDIIAWYF